MVKLNNLIKQRIVSGVLLVVLFFCFSLLGVAAAEDLIIEGDSTCVISTDSTYDAVVVRDQGSLIVNGGANLTFNSLSGEDESAFVLDGCTVSGHINITSSKRIHILNANLNVGANSSMHSDNIIVTLATIQAQGPSRACNPSQSVPSGLECAFELNSGNNIYISNATISASGGTDNYGLRGECDLQIVTAANLYLEENATLSCLGRPGDLLVQANVAYIFNSNLNVYSVHDKKANIQVDAEEINGSDNHFYAEGGEGVDAFGENMAGFSYIPAWRLAYGYWGYGSYGYFGTMYFYLASNGGDTSINLTAKIVNLASNILECRGGEGGSDYNPFFKMPGYGGDALVTITSTENEDPSLYNNTYTLVEGLGGGGGGGSGYASCTINPYTIEDAAESTVETPKKDLEDFVDYNLWSPDTTMGWWDIDGTFVYQHYITINENTQTSARAMQTNFNKQGLGWSLFGGCIGSANSNKDFSGFNTVRLWVKGDTNLLVKLRDGNYNEQDISVQNLSSVDGMACLDFNFDHVTNVDLQNIDNVLFFAAPGDDTASGTFYIDSVALTNTKKIEDFASLDWDPDVTLGWWDSDGSSVYQRSLQYGLAHEGWSCMRVDYDKSGCPWSYFAGYISTLNPNADFRDYRKVSFWLYGDVDILVKLRDRNFNEQDVATVSGEADGWKLVEVDFSDISILKEDIDTIMFFVAPGNDTETGTFYLDDIKLNQGA